MSHRALPSVRIASVLLLLTTASLSAQMARQAADPLSLRAFSDPRFQPAPAVSRLEAAQSLLPAEAQASWTGFQKGSEVRWQAYVDRRTGRLESAVGGGVPWILPGGKADLASLEMTARAALPSLAPLLGVDAASLVLNPGRSGKQAEFLWYVDFDVRDTRRSGLLVEGARVVFRVSHGNLIEIGAENLPAPDAVPPTTLVTREQALAAVSGFVGGFGAADFLADTGSLHLLPVSLADPRFTDGFEPGNGRGLALVWEITFRRRGIAGSWRARVDAENGRVVELLDTNRYGQVNGGVFPSSPTVGAETVLPMPFADAGAAGTADPGGFYPGFGPATSHLNGQYVLINDTCGPITKTSDWTGNISFGLSGGTDCTTPGPGQGGNTHSARTQFYQVNRIKQAGRSWLPSNTWLQGKLTVNVNLNQTCNAYWDDISGTLNFFRSGGGCNNTGEIAAVSLHEYGHGLDQNDGNGSSTDNGTGETYGDFTAALMTHSSCVGPGFLPGNCGGYGNTCTACTGVRDIDYAKHSESTTPATVASFTQTHCGGARPDYPGPCGREGHCESYVSSEALWDFASRDLPNPGSAGAWTIAEGLWYLSRATSTSAFTCNTAPATWTSDGCATGSLWRTLRAADDDDGNLANGTPHGAALFAAFNRHGIACATDPGAGVTFAGCTPPAVPTLTLTPSPGQVLASWTSSGAGTVYDLYRSELGCGAGFVRIAGNLAGTSYPDTAVSGGFSYSYQLVAHPPSGTACAAAPTACQSATPPAPVCSPPAPPATVSVTGFSIGQISLSWSAVAGAAGYNVYRAATAAGPYTLVGSVTGTAYTDTGLIGNTPYLYTVRAFLNGCESSDSAAATAATATCKPVSLYKNTFETGSGLAGWSTSILTGAATDWRGIQACSPARSGTGIFRFGGTTCGSSYGSNEAVVASPPAVAVPAGTGNTRLSFWHRRSFEDFYDGGTLVTYLDGGASPNYVSAAALSGEVYSSAIATGSTSCPPAGLGGVPSFSSATSTMANTVVDLDAVCNAGLASTNGCAGHTVKPGFLAIADCSLGFSGWFLDDVEVTACQVMSPMDFYTLTPCRLIDTRAAAGPLGGPSLPAGGTRTFTVTGTCGIPTTAQSLAINLTAVTPGSGGYLQVYPGSSTTPPVVSAINFIPGVTRANNSQISLAFDGTGTITVKSGAGVAVDFVIDVVGYFQ